MNLETERQILEPFSDGNFEEAYSIFINDSVKKYLFDEITLSRDEVLEFLKTSQETFNDKKYGLWINTLKTSKKQVGFTGLWHFFDEDLPQLIYALLPEHTGKGYAKEASLKIMNYAFVDLKFPYLDASCDAPNIASHKTALSLGMKKLKEETINGLPTVFYRKEN